MRLLVANAPDADARVIAVATDLAFPLAQVFRIAAEQPALVHDDHAEVVAGIEQFGRGRIVRGAIGVAAEFLQLGDAKILKRIRQRRADARHVLMIAGAQQLVVLAVQQKSLVLVEGEGANAKLGFFAVNNLTAHFNCRNELVEFWIFGGPEFVFVHCKFA